MTTDQWVGDSLSGINRIELSHATKLQAARHLRWDHGMSRRKVALRLDVREKWVKDYVDAFAKDKPK